MPCWCCPSPTRFMQRRYVSAPLACGALPSPPSLPPQLRISISAAEENSSFAPAAWAYSLSMNPAGERRHKQEARMRVVPSPPPLSPSPTQFALRLHAFAAEARASLPGQG